MKYKIETIPVWDAFGAESECPFCLLEKEAEERYLGFFLGNSVMVPEMRIEVNSTGFCRTHYPMLFATRKNRHSLGLLTHTRLSESVGREKKLLWSLLGITGKNRGKKALAEAAAFLHKETEQCMICSRMEETLKRYIFTALYLWKKDEEGFRNTYAASKGFCRHHLASLLGMAGEALPAALLREWLEATIAVENESRRRLESELLWYTQKFDYQNSEKPWGSSKDALERAIQKLTGKIVGDP
jgi:hypothetical protein